MEWLEQEWSPQQIAQRLRIEHDGDQDMTVSHETIYRADYTSRWKIIPKVMSKKLRTGRYPGPHDHLAERNLRRREDHHRSRIGHTAAQIAGLRH